MDHKEVITNAWFQSRKCNFDETFHPIRAQVVPGSVVTYGALKLSTTENEDVEILSFDTFDYFPRLRGTLSHVYFELSFQLKAEDESAKVTYQLQARDRGYNSWIDLCVAVPVDPIGTSYQTYLFKGYMDIKNHISEIPFEMRIIAQSNEDDQAQLVSFTCTWALQAPGGTGKCYSAMEYKNKLYCGIQDTIYFQTGTENYVACTGTMGQARAMAVSEVISGDDRLFAVTNTLMRVKGFEDDEAWATITNSPDGAWSLVQSNIDGGTETLYIGCNNGEIRKTINGVDFATCGLAGSSPIRALVEFETKLYAASENGDVYVWETGTENWETVGHGTMALSEVYCLCEHNSELYAGGMGADVYELNENKNGWVTTGGLAGNASRTNTLISYDDSDGAVLYAGTGTAADVDYWNNVDTWTNTGELSGDHMILNLAVYEHVGTIYACTQNLGRIWIANITSTWKFGFLTGRMKNDIAGQETFIQAVGSVGGIGLPANE